MEEFNPNQAFKKLGIPLSLVVTSISNIASAEELLTLLLRAEEDDADILFCFNHGALVDDPTRDWGHLCLFDKMIDGEIRIIDPSPNHPKWRKVSVEKMFRAMVKHGEKPTAAGLWEIVKLPGGIPRGLAFPEASPL